MELGGVGCADVLCSPVRRGKIADMHEHRARRSGRVRGGDAIWPVYFRRGSSFLASARVESTQPLCR
jgi:hypothetical protein